MKYYTNRRSLELAYGEDEVDGLIPEDAALEKAAAAAYEEINSYLHTAGYVLPIEFKEASGDSTSTLPGLLQRHSDAITASNLASAEDLHKQRYDLDRADAIKYLEDVRTGKLRIAYADGKAMDLRHLLPNEALPNGASLAVTFARPRIFDRQAFPFYPTGKEKL